MSPRSSTAPFAPDLSLVDEKARIVSRACVLIVRRLPGEEERVKLPAECIHQLPLRRCH
eukprot:CAMPEP_0185562706 /NCGR_PEP_ID=MMETSP1381-20130426/61999_1 /TAXON_ID=298111 /ORGANISM="Pavlova sp., Strain CCMP459" /LENGTH=58 /DNA_ID=CAMNT_0028176553 /DNA_START=90 /DNA_END=263 /DNA_ORIENTATION=+